MFHQDKLSQKNVAFRNLPYQETGKTGSCVFPQKLITWLNQPLRTAISRDSGLQKHVEHVLHLIKM